MQFSTLAVHSNAPRIVKEKFLNCKIRSDVVFTILDEQKLRAGKDILGDCVSTLVKHGLTIRTPYIQIHWNSSEKFFNGVSIID